MRPRPHAVLGCWLLLLVLCTGCHSIYHRARETLPPDPCAQLRLRIDEARRAEAFAAQANGKLRASLDRRLTGPTLEADVDRLEMAAFELERRVAAARDVAPLCEEQPQLAGEIERLQLQARVWQNYVNGVRRTMAEPSQDAD